MTTGFYTHADCTLHEMGADHPECPQRLAAIEDRLIAAQIAPWLERHDAAPPAYLRSSSVPSAAEAVRQYSAGQVEHDRRVTFEVALIAVPGAPGHCM